MSAVTARRMGPMRPIGLIFLLWLTGGSLRAEDIGALPPGQVPNQPPGSVAMELPASVTLWYRNPDGSCVQCSGGMVGCHNNLIVWSTLLWDTEYGPAVRGGSSPGRVANYARARGMRLFNVTGEPTFAWMQWAAKTNRFAAIGAGGSHFQTLYGHALSPAESWQICNNNSTAKIDEYTPAGFSRLHRASGLWCFVPDEAAPAVPPRIVKWWD